MLRTKNQIGTGALLAALVVLASSIAEAQPIPGTPYFRQQVAEPYTGCEGTPQILGMNSTFAEYPVQFPFAFKFYDTESSQWTVSDFPIIAINTPSFISCNSAAGSSSTPNGFIAPFWECERADSVSISVSGVAPQRKVCVEWVNFRDSFSTPTPSITTKIEMYEGPSGRIDISYAPVTGTGTPFTGTMGMEDENAGRPILFHPSNCTISCTPQQANDFANQRITYVQDPGVELQAVRLTAPDFAFLNTPVDLRVQVQNLHRNTVGPAIIEIQASKDANFTNATTIGSVSRSFTGFELGNFTVPTTLPTSLGAGRYYYRAVVDPANAIAEAVETNNIVAAENFTRVIETAPELQAVAVSVSSLQVNAGGTVDVTYSVRNNGGAVATSATIDVMLSTNPVISPQDSALGSTQVTLQPGQTENGMQTVTIPSEVNSGEYYIGIFVDVGGAIQELNESNNGLAIFDPVTVTGGTLAVTTRAIPQAVLGETYTALAVATGGDGNYTWSIAQGTLPMGLGIVPETGQFFGRAGMVEMQCFTLQVDSAGQTASRELCLIVSDPAEPLTVVNRSVPDGVVGQEYSFQLIATGGIATSSASWTANGLPEGLTISAGGLLGGTPTVTGTTAFSVTAMAGGESANRDLQIIIRANPNLLIQPKVLSTARFGEPYSDQLTAEGGVAPIFWTLSDPNQLPDGIDLSSDGALSGTPNEVGRFRFQVAAFDSAGGQSVARDTETFVLVVEDVAGTFVVSTEALEPAYIGEGYEAAIAAAGGSRPYDWSIGRVPDGIGSRVNPTTNELELFGAPTTVGTTNLLITVEDSQGRSTQKAFALRVLAARTVGPITPEDSGCTAATPDFGLVMLGLFALLGLRRRRRR